MIEFENISFGYGGNQVLKGINFGIASGETVALAGANGSGKTTLALLINGILRPTKGKLRVCGLNPADKNDAARLKQKVGIVFQKPDNQLVSSTVEREVAFALENLNTAREEMHRRVSETIDLMGLASLKNRSTAELSGGEKQRLALASVIVAKPEILILDEPGSFLDESGKRQLSAALELLKAANPDLTLIRITQYAYIARQYSRLVALEKGEIAFDGLPDRLFEDGDKCHRIGIDVPLDFRIGRIEYIPKPEAAPKGHSPSPSNTIQLENLGFSYIDAVHEFELSDINLTINNKEIYGLVGPSGSGKSTLLHIIGGLCQPQEGRIKYNGFKPRPGGIAISFQEPERQFFLETVDKELKFGPQNLSLENIENITDTAYIAIGLDKIRFANRDPFTLSGGEKRRLALGIIVALQPDFVLFDEPTCALDASGIDAFKKLVRYFHERGAGIIIVSHHGDIIFELAERIIHLADGKVVAESSKQDFFRQEEYAEFLSVPQMISFQKRHFGEIRYFSEAELFKAISPST